jgi:hypothetical protein
MDLYHDQAENEFTIALANGDVLKVNNGSIYALDKDEFIDKAVDAGDKTDTASDLTDGKDTDTEIFSSTSTKLDPDSAYKDVNINNGQIKITYQDGSQTNFTYGDMSQLDRQAMREYIQERARALKEILPKNKIRSGTDSMLRLRAESEFLAHYAKTGKILDVQGKDIVPIDKDLYNGADEIDRLSLKGYWNGESDTMTLPMNADADNIVIGDLAERRS